MAILEWLELSKLAEIVGVSLWGYPIMLSAHSFGLVIVVGIVFMLDLRILGFAGGGLSFVGLHKMMKLAWAGFVINAVSGFCLFAAQATYFITNLTFLVKIAAIFVAMAGAAFIQKMLVENGERWDTGGVISGQAKSMAILSLALWSLAIVAGRFIAYL